MIDYGKVKSSLYPQEIEFTPEFVFVSSDIQERETTLDDNTFIEYEYEYVRYTKDEYIQLIAAKNNTLAEELEATKILLGVD